MQELIAQLNAIYDNNFSNLRLVAVEYNSKLNKSTFKFHYLGETFVDARKKELVSFLKEYLSNSCDVAVKIKEYYLDCDVLKTMVINFINNFFKGIAFSIDESKVKCEKKDDKYFFSVFLEKTQFDYLSENNFIGLIKDFFSDTLFNEINGEIVLENQNLSGENELLKYKTVQPEPYISLKQQNLFESVKPVNEYLRNNKFVVFDLETTGLFFNQDEITEIGAVKIVDGKIVETFSTLIKPSKDIPEEVTKITGISNETVKDAPSFNQVVMDFKNFCEGCTLVGYNILDFDIKFLNFSANKLSINFDNKIDDALIMARKFCPGLKRYRLKDISTHLGVTLDNAHRALFDTLATAEVFIKLTDFME